MNLEACVDWGICVRLVLTLGHLLWQPAGAPDEPQSKRG